MLMHTMRHPLFARVYACLSPMLDRQGGAEHRRQLVAGLTGAVVEIGAGDGANFAHYPGGVEHVLAVEPEPYLRDRSTRQARAAPVTIDVVDGFAERLPVADASVDAAVLSLLLCSVEDPHAVLAEAFRILRPGGSLRFYEHVIADRPGRQRTVQAVADATLWPRLFGGCHTGRDAAAAITAAGFRIDTIDRFAFPPGRPSPASPHILGRATRPTASGGEQAQREHLV